MEPIKVVARYINGKVIKGLTQDFFPNKDRFHLQPFGKSTSEASEIFVKDLKAVFFVRDYAGDYQYDERKSYREGEKASGRKMEVTFKDGEVMVGSTLGYDPSRPGFFLFPADPKSNNMRVFVVSTAVKKTRFI
jgi:hypothetical protein